MNSYQLFSSSTRASIIIYRYDIKQCLDKYATDKTPTPFHPTSKWIKQLQKFFDKLESCRPLNNKQLQWLAQQLKKLEDRKTYYTYSACSALYHKMGILIAYADDFPTVFKQIVIFPELHDYIKTIEKSGTLYFKDELITYHPQSLEYIAKSKPITQTILNLHPEWYELMKKDYQYLETACNALDRLCYEINIPYEYMLNNTIFIFKHAKHAEIIADVLIKLRKAKLEYCYKDLAEKYLAKLMDDHPETFLKFSHLFLTNSIKVLDQLQVNMTVYEFYRMIDDAVFNAEHPSNPRRRFK